MSDYCVSCAQMKILEQKTDAAGLSYYQMMENAGRIAADRIVEITMASPINDAEYAEEYADRHTVRLYPYALDRPIRARVYCGKGNNGGDGFVVARLLQRQGWEVQIVLVDGEPVTPDAIANWKLAMELGIPILGLEDVEGPEVSSVLEEVPEPEAASDSEAASESAPIPETDFAPDVIVDAIYGTGFHGRLREAGAKAAAQIARARAGAEGMPPARVFALDIPSGMGGDLEDEKELDERCVRADVTITFHARKPVHLQAFAGKYCGEIITADIGIVDPARDAAVKDAAVKDSAAKDAAAEEASAEATGNCAEPAVGSEDTDPRTFAADSGQTYSFADFVEIISRLRAPDGCPWDRAQTHQTLKKYLLEETQEAAEAIDHEDDENFCEELGDVLLQIVLNAQVAKERGAFTIEDVIQGISEKMIRRHPWVFGDMHVDSPEEGEKLWEEIKKKEKREKNSAE